MNAIIRTHSLAAVTFLLLSARLAHAFDFSETFFLDRYTILENGDLKHDQGNLLRSGQFRVLLSEITPLFGIALSDFEPISGRSVMSTLYYNAYKSAGVIPRWTRSRDEFYLGFVPHVIVGVSGRGDPNPIPVIHQQPQNQRVLVGNSAWLWVDAIPSGYLSYQWRFKGKNLPDETSSLLIVQGVTKTNAGIYTVAMDAGGRTVVSRRALLTVVTPVSVATHPQSRSLREGNRVVFRVSVKGTGPFTYQWFHNETLLSGATKSFYTIPRINATNEGNYRVVVGNGLSYATSDPAVLTVGP